MVSVGYIGLGTMGKPMAENLVDDGYDVTVYDLHEDADASLVESSATGAGDPAGVAENAELVFLSLPSPEIVEEVVADLKSMIEPNSVLVDLSTLVPQTTVTIADRLDERNVDVLGAPVTGGRPGATAGALTLMVGGNVDVLEHCDSVMRSFADEIVHIGDGPDDGHAIKLLRNYIGFAQEIAASEAVLLAQKVGVDTDPVLEVLDSVNALGEPTATFLPEKVEGNYDLGFSLGLMEKDLKLLTRFSEDNDAPLLLANVVRQMVGYGRPDLGADVETTGLHLYLESVIQGSSDA